MKLNLAGFLLGLGFLFDLNLRLSTCLAQGTAFTYQGRLTDGGNPASGSYDFRFRLSRDSFGDVYIGTSQFFSAQPVIGGQFTVNLDFGTGVFNGSNYWLQVDVKTNGAGSYTTLIPLQKLMPVPYAMFAHTASNLTGTLSTTQLVGNLPATQLSGPLPSVNLSGTYSSAVSFTHPASTYAGDGANLTNLSATQLASGTVPEGRLSAAVSLLGQTIESGEITDGTIQSADLNPGGFDTTFWRTTGNAGTIASDHFLGTTDNQPLELRVGGRRALWLLSAGDSVTDGDSMPDGAVNLIAGSSQNRIFGAVVGVTISGGGASNYNGSSQANAVASDYGTIGGGLGNYVGASGIASTIAGGKGNAVGQYASYSAIGGGVNNSIAENSTSAVIAGGLGAVIAAGANGGMIGGGTFNTIEAGSYYGTIAGGSNNRIGTNSPFASIGGGLANYLLPDSAYATIPGGTENTAGQYAFAAGRRAKANHTGTFVWADSTGADFVSTSDNQFLIRAGGGLGINTNSPQSALHVHGTVTASGFAGSGAGLSGLPNAATTATSANTANAIVARDAAGNFAAGTITASFSGNGAALTSLNATQLASGTLADARLSANVALRAGGNTFAGNQIVTNGNVGIGTTTPGAAFAISSPTGTQALDVEGSRSGTFSSPVAFVRNTNSSGSSGPALRVLGQGNAVDGVLNIGNTGTGKIIAFGAVGGEVANLDTNGNFSFGSVTRQMLNLWGTVYGVGVQNNTFYTRSDGGFAWFNKGVHNDAANNAGSGGATLMTLDSAGNLRTVTGTISTLSDRDAKTNFEPVDARDVLERVAALPIARWSFKQAPATQRHIGPMAQDFHAAFNVGLEATGICTVDADGVALAAIQGLNQKLETELKNKESRIAELEQRLTALETLLKK